MGGCCSPGVFVAAPRLGCRKPQNPYRIGQPHNRPVWEACVGDAPVGGGREADPDRHAVPPRARPTALCQSSALPCLHPCLPLCPCPCPDTRTTVRRWLG